MRSVLQVPAENCEPLRFFGMALASLLGRTMTLPARSLISTLREALAFGPCLSSSQRQRRVATFRFPLLNISVPPKPGRAILWPHLMDSDLMTVEERTQHEGDAGG